jgi:hypothetical protein
MDRSIGRHPNDQAFDNWKCGIAKSEINHIENDRFMFLMALFISIKCGQCFWESNGVVSLQQRGVGVICRAF